MEFGGYGRRIITINKSLSRYLHFQGKYNTKYNTPRARDVAERPLDVRFATTGTEWRPLRFRPAGLEHNKKGYPFLDILFLILRAMPGGSIEVYAPLRSLQSERPLDILQRLALFLNVEVFMVWIDLRHGDVLC